MGHLRKIFAGGRGCKTSKIHIHTHTHIYIYIYTHILKYMCVLYLSYISFFPPFSRLFVFFSIPSVFLSSFFFLSLSPSSFIYTYIHVYIFCTTLDICVCACVHSMECIYNPARHFYIENCWIFLFKKKKFLFIRLVISLTFNYTLLYNK